MYKQELKLFLANDFTDIPSLDYFAIDVSKYGQAAVSNALNVAMEARKLNSDQKAGVLALSKMCGNVWLFHGIGGVGKTEIAVTLILYQYIINSLATPHEACKIAVLTPINAQGDSLAVRLDNVLLTEYRTKHASHLASPDQVPEPKYPVVCRIHAKATEIHVYKGDATKARDKETGGRGPDYVQEVTTADAQGALTAGDMPELAMDFMILNTYKQGAGGHFDKRLQQRQLSLGMWMLRRAGYPDVDGNVHPIANPQAHRQFRDRLDAFARGEKISPEDREDLTRCANAVAKDVLENMVDVAIMTHDTFMQARVHSYTLFRAIFHDEAGKTAETSDISGWVYSRQRTEDGSYTESVPQVLFGDLLQPNPLPTGLTGTFAA